MQKRCPRVTKPIMVGKTPCKLLCAFEVKVSNKLLARYKLLGPRYQSFRWLIHSQTSWPYLISELLVAGSSWPCIFLHPKCFCLVNINISDRLSVSAVIGH